MTTVLPRWSDQLQQQDSYMTKTPFIRNNSSSFEDDEDDDDEDLSNIIPKPEDNHDPEQVKIEINKKVANAVPVVNKMNQHIYADHHNQNHHPPKGNQKCGKAISNAIVFTLCVPLLNSGLLFAHTVRNKNFYVKEYFSMYSTMKNKVIVLHSFL